MSTTLTIRPQHFAVDGCAPLTYGVFLTTEREYEGLECWQSEDCMGVFICYSRSIEGAERVVELLGKLSYA